MAAGGNGWTVRGCDATDEAGVMLTADMAHVLVTRDGTMVAEVPRAVALEALAAEASDRLGWRWEVSGGPTAAHPDASWLAAPRNGPRLGARWTANANGGEIETALKLDRVAPDVALAALYGRFQLVRAMAERPGPKVTRRRARVGVTIR